MMLSVRARTVGIQLSLTLLACWLGGSAPRAYARDCNANGVADDEEIASGRAADCNANDVPDDCDVRAASYGLRQGPIFRADGAVLVPGVLADWDRDGVADLALGEPNKVEIRLLHGAATGELQPWKTAPLGTFDLAAFRGADLDGDGLTDLVVPTRHRNAPSLEASFRLDRLLALPEGGFGAPETLSLISSAQILFATGDLDRDGDIDLAAIQTPPAQLVPLLNDGRGSFAAGTAFGVDVVNGPIAGDFDDDGQTDLVHLTTRAEEIQLYYGGPGLTWPELRTVSISPAAVALSAGDLDGAGGVDLAAATAWGAVVAFAARGRGELLPVPLPVDRGYTLRLRIGDLDADGMQDVLSHGYEDVCGQARERWRWNLGMGGLRFAAGRSHALSLSPQLVDLTDFSGDGLADLVSAAFVLDPQNGSWYHAAAVYLGTPQAWSRDEDADGVPDECATDTRDCNWNRIPDTVDLAAGRSRDCDADRVPDECEPDCNRNGTQDSCDLRDATSLDRDENGVPDECQVLSGDCNDNGVADALEILADAAADCDRSGLLDACELSPRIVFSQVASNVIPLPSAAREIATADFNEDGRPDLALVLRSDCCRSPPLPGAVALLVGNPGGGFVMQGPLNAAGEPDEVLSGDLDGDGDLDLAVQNESAPCQSSRTLELIWLDPQRGFLGSSARQAPGELRSIALADLEGDGDLDIAAGLAGDAPAAVALFLNDGRGELELSALPTSAEGVRSMAAGDWNRDGRSDLALATDAPPGIGLLESSPGGALTERRMAEAVLAPVEVYLEDLDGDDDLDLIGGTVAEVGLVDFFWNEAAGAVRREQFAPRASPRAISFVDVNGNGKKDLCITGGTSESTSTVDPGFVEIDTDPALGSPRPLRGFAVRAITPRGAWADFDLDGRLDVAHTDSARPQLIVLPAIAQVAGGGRFTVGPSPVDIKAADFDADGDDDLTLVTSSSRELSFLVQEDGGLTQRSWAPSLLPPPRSLAIGDWNADGRIDLAMASDASIAIFPNRRGLFTPGEGGEKPFELLPLSTAPTDLLAADLDADGDLDLATCNTLFSELDDNVTVIRGQGDGTFAPGRNYLSGRWPTALVAADMTGDGALDLVSNSIRDSGLHLLVNRGQGAFLPPQLFATSRNVHSLAAIDADGDGDTDFLATDSNAVGSFLFQSQEEGFAESQINEHGALRFAIPDLTADGLPELVLAPAYEGTLHVYTNAGGGAFAGAQAFQFKDQAVPLAPEGGGQGGSGDPGFDARYAVGDFNRDGKADLAMALVQYTTVLIFHNQTLPSKPDADHDGILDACEPDGPVRFRRADPNRDARVDLSDAVSILRHLFITGEPLACRKEADANDDGRVDVSDAVGILGHLYLGTDAPPAPYPGCGEDPTADEIACEQPLTCG